MRYCKKCTQTKELDSFYKSGKHYSSNCKPCSSTIKLEKKSGKSQMKVDQIVAKQSLTMDRVVMSNLDAKRKKKLLDLDIKKVEISKVTKFIGSEVKIKAVLIINNIPMQYEAKARNDKAADKHIQFMHEKPALVAKNYLKELRG